MTQMTLAYPYHPQARGVTDRPPIDDHDPDPPDQDYEPPDLGCGC